MPLLSSPWPGHPMAPPSLRQVRIARCRSGRPWDEHGQISCTVGTCIQVTSHEETAPSWNKRHLWRSLYQLHGWSRSRAKKVRAADVTGQVSAHHGGDTAE